MTQVIRKLKTDSAAIAAKETVSPAKISNTDIVALVTDSSVILTEPVKKYINIKYNALGYSSVNRIILGMQYDHRVSWLHFDLEDLIWNLNEERGYNERTKYDFYKFKIIFSRLHDNENTEAQV